MTSPARADDPSLGFALVRGDLPFRLQRRLGLIPPDGLGLVGRALFWSMLGRPLRHVLEFSHTR